MVPSISVILPVYNQEPYLTETIESVLGQSLTDFELLIQDDGSTDGSARIIAQYAAQDARIRAFYAPNAGKCAVTNQLVREARGVWCAFLDADDVMLPERLARQVAFHQEHPELDASSCHCFYIDHLGHTLGTQRYPGLRTVTQCQQVAANGQFIQCSFTGLMVSRAAFMASKGLKSQFWPCDDFEFFNRFIQEGHTLVIIEQVLMKYRIHNSAITVQRPFHAFDMVGYVMHCFAAQREGKSEITFDEFMLLRSREPWLRKLNRRRYNYSQLFFRSAGVAMMSKKYFDFLWQVAASFLLSPNYIFLKMKNLYGTQ